MELTTLIVAIVAAIAAVCGLGLAYLNYRINAKRALPSIQLYGSDISYFFYLDTAEPGWKVVEIVVGASDFSKKILAHQMWTQTGNVTSSQVSDWKDRCCFPEGADPVELLLISNDCIEAYLLFVCLAPFRDWFKPWQKAKRTVHYKFTRGQNPPMHDHPYWKSFVGA